jgi:hypothetical protein
MERLVFGSVAGGTLLLVNVDHNSRPRMAEWGIWEGVSPDEIPERKGTTGLKK